MNNRHDSKQFTATDIQNYLDGKLSPHEMNLMEKAALEDPFLADAIDGLALEERSENTRNLTLLKEMLEKKANPVRVIPFYKRSLTQAIAAFLLLALGLSLVYKLLVNENASQLAVNKQQTVTSPKPDATPPAPPAILKSYKQDTNTVETPGRSRTLPANTKPLAKKDNTRIADKNEDTAPLPEVELKEAIIQAQLRQTSNRMAEKNEQSKAKTLKNDTVMFKAPDSLAYSQGRLDEVVVVGYGSQKKRSVIISRASQVSDSTAAPVNGVVTYKEYLAKNKRVPAGEENTRGEVVVNFRVKRSGKITNIRILKSLSPLLDKEAIRLVKEGPAWKRTKGNGNASVSVIF